jgi:hypothetical protein
MDLVYKLLEKDQKKRLGANGPEEILSHPVFKNISISELEK